MATNSEDIGRGSECPPFNYKSSNIHHNYDPRTPTLSPQPRPPSLHHHSSSRAPSSSSPLSIVHFNDVYNIEGREKEPRGGAARFKSALDQLQHLEPLVLFSGDALAPSTISVVMKGEQMVPVLNKLGIHCAVYGNHDFDYGVDHLVRLAKQMDFPWLMSNVYWRHSGAHLADGRKKHILRWQGRKIGLMGLVEKEWIATLGAVEMADIIYEDFVTTAQQLVKEFQEEECDLLIALTHMRVPNDLRLAQEVPELNMILGGHDHHYEQQQVGDVLVLKSGSEFREFSQITVTFPEGVRNSTFGHTPSNSRRRPIIDVQRHEVTGALTPDPDVDNMVQHYLSKVDKGLQLVLGKVDVSLEGRFRQVRTKETNLGNLITDIMRRKMKTDVALLNSGTLRSDTIHDPGLFRMRDLLDILPMMDSLVRLELTGQQLLQALENGVSQYPRMEGRFPQVSGINFVFDPSQPSGTRVLAERVLVAGEPLEEDKLYSLTTRGYVGHGKDGYDILKNCKVITPADEGPLLSAIVREHIETCYASSNETHGNTRIHPRVEGRIISNPLLESSGSE